MEKAKYESEFTCPKCGHKQIEKFSEIDCCNFIFKCKNCGNIIKPKKDGSCVFCNYGTLKCKDFKSHYKNGKCRCCNQN